MPELKQDERKIEIVNGKAVITRTTVEEYDAEEYLRQLDYTSQMKAQKEEEVKEIGKIVDDMTKHKEVLEGVRKKELEEAKKEREEATKTEKKDQ